MNFDTRTNSCSRQLRHNCLTRRTDSCSLFQLEKEVRCWTLFCNDEPKYCWTHAWSFFFVCSCCASRTCNWSTFGRTTLHRTKGISRYFRPHSLELTSGLRVDLTTFLGIGTEMISNSGNKWKIDSSRARLSELKQFPRGGIVVPVGKALRGPEGKCKDTYVKIKWLLWHQAPFGDLWWEICNLNPSIDLKKEGDFRPLPSFRPFRSGLHWIASGFPWVDCIPLSSEKTPLLLEPDLTTFIPSWPRAWGYRRLEF